MFASLLSRSSAAHLHTVGAKSKYLLFAVCAYAVFEKQKYYRASIADEEEGTHDRINREAYMVLPDGRMAQVYPVVHSTNSFYGVWRALCETLSPLP
ncbi:hypothetical protein DIPPA_33467 [Diplonema papillatum]|nr:hypothetical protein DIPPA_33467 [Diplonema papillatum]